MTNDGLAAGQNRPQLNMSMQSYESDGFQFLSATSMTRRLCARPSASRSPVGESDDEPPVYI